MMDEHVRACLRAILDGKQMQLNLKAGWTDVEVDSALSWLGGTSDFRVNVRIKPASMCKLAGVEFPKPMSAKPANGDVYYVASPQSVDQHTWRDDSADDEWLALRICHTTFEAAEAHSKAMRAVNAQAVGKRYELLADRFEHKAGTVVYQAKYHDYGLAHDDERATGEFHESVTLDKDGDYPFFTCPVRLLKELP